MKYILLVLIVALILFFAPRQSISYTEPEKESVKEYAERRVGEEFGLGQWPYFEEIVNRESRWLPLAQNPKSTAFGLCQFLSKTWKSTSYQKTSDPYIQLEACFEYVEGRYGMPQKAIVFHDRKGWY